MFHSVIIQQLLNLTYNELILKQHDNYYWLIYIHHVNQQSTEIILPNIIHCTILLGQ